MVFLLSSQNIFAYLIEQGLCEPKEQHLSQIKSKSAKNFNLLVSLPQNRHLLVKQEPHDLEGETNGAFLYEWRIHELLQKFPDLSYIRLLISEVIHFDPHRSIIVFNYLNDYIDLLDFYAEEEVFPSGIAAKIGASLAAVHRATLDREKYKNFLSQTCQDIEIDRVPNFLRRLERIEPEVFGVVSAEALKFFALYQRYESTAQAIAELNKAFEPCCLTHNDLKLDNILLRVEWEQALSKAERSPLTSLSKEESRGDTIVRLIDWEKWAWGDPAFDLGTIIANYLKIWLSSLASGKTIDLETALRLATTPLEAIQPSIAALTKAYCDRFPEILERRPDFLTRVVQFTGLALIRKIQVKIQYKYPLGNRAIPMLQVAKTLLCRPEQSIPIIFGTTASELTTSSPIPA